MLVKRAQSEGEDQLRWRGQSLTGQLDDDDDDEEEDPRTDLELLDVLTNTVSPVSAIDDADKHSKWTAVGANEELPDALEDEDVILAEGYDAEKAEREERKNQAESANFSGGGE